MRVSVLIPQPTLSLTHTHSYLCPIDQSWLHSQRFPPPWSGLLRAITVQFYALLLQLLHGEQSRQSICEGTEGNKLALCSVLTYRRDDVVKSKRLTRGKGNLCDMCAKVSILEAKCQDRCRNEVL